MTKFKRAISLVMCAVIMSTTIIGTSVFASAANVSASLGYDQPEDSGDYAYWSGKKVVKSGSTTTAEIKWMQAALNYCIANEGLKATKLTVDGSFGPASKAATIAFQKAAGLNADGSFGPATIKKMKAVLNDGKATFKKTSTANQNSNSNFKKQNVLQVNAANSSNYISGNWYKLSNGTDSKYKYIKTAGCGIVSLVSAVYNLGGTFDKKYMYDTIDEFFDWAYKNGHWKYKAYWSLFTKSDDKFGNKYGFKVSDVYGSSGSKVSLDALVKHIKNGGTAVVHVYGHFMAIADYKVENGTTYLKVFDPAPGSGTNYNSLNRKDITSAAGNWFSLSDLKNDGGTKGKTDTKSQRYENIEIDAYWLVSKK